MEALARANGRPRSVAGEGGSGPCATSVRSTCRMWPINSRSSIYLYQFHVDYLVLVIVSPFWTNSIRFASTGRGLSGLAHLWRTMSAVQGLSRLAWRSPAHRLAGVRAVLCRGRWASARVAPPRLKRRHPDRARGDGEEGVTAADSSLRQPGACRATCAYGDLRAGRHANWCLPRLPWGGGCCVVAVCGATAGVVVRASSPLLPRRPRGCIPLGPLSQR